MYFEYFSRHRNIYMSPAPAPKANAASQGHGLRCSFQQVRSEAECEWAQSRLCAVDISKSTYSIQLIFLIPKTKIPHISSWVRLIIPSSATEAAKRETIINWFFCQVTFTINILVKNILTKTLTLGPGNSVQRQCSALLAAAKYHEMLLASNLNVQSLQAFDSSHISTSHPVQCQTSSSSSSSTTIISRCLIRTRDTKLSSTSDTYQH